MSMLWVISGAGRRVGKTTFALHLCEILPDSVYAKCGQSKSKPDKPGEFFDNLEDLHAFIATAQTSNQHIVVESNAMAKLGEGDMVIFIDGVAGKTDFRTDSEQLRGAADIKISPEGTIAAWQEILAAKPGLSDKAICIRVCQLLRAQQRYLFDRQPSVRSKVWLETEGAYIFGRGLALLLENVAHFGTLQDAAKASKMSYRYAWNLIRMAENHFGQTLIRRQVGGQDGGGSQLSAEGLMMLEVFTELNEQVAVFADEKFAELYERKSAGCVSRNQ